MTLFKTLQTNIAAVFLLAILILTQQSCSSGSSSSSAVAPFSIPTNASTLRAALLTGAAGETNFAYWECALDGSNTRLTYRLLSNGTGIETDLSNPTLQSTFTWQTTSVNAMTTTVDTSNVQNSLSNINFTDQDNMSLESTGNLRLDCTRQAAVDTTQNEPAGNNSLSYGGVEYSLTHGFEESFRYSPSQQNDTHSASDLDVADTLFRQTTIFPIGLSTTQIIWRPNNATVWLRATLYAPGGNGIESATYNYEPEETEDNSPLLANSFFFQEGSFGVDIDGDGSIDSDAGEFIDVTAGTITITRLSGQTRMSFDVTLANGVPLSGSFEGIFPLFANQ